MKKLLFIISIFISQTIKAQSFNPYIDRLSAELGLSNATIYSIYQDSQGFMWFGTEEDGLCRYDGYNMIFYQFDSQDSTTISHNSVSSIIEDKHHNLWMATGRYISQYNPVTNRFKRFPIYEKDGSLASVQNCGELKIDAHGKLWFVGFDGTNSIGYFDEKKQQFIIHYHPKYHNSDTDQTSSIYIDNQGNIWIGATNGLMKYDSQNDAFRWAYQTKNYARIDAITQDNDGNIWFGSSIIGLFRMRPDGNVTQFTDDMPNSVSYNTINKLLKDQAGRLWVSTENGLNVIENSNEEQPTFVHLFPPVKGKGLNYHLIRGLFQDKQGIVWVGLFRHGINKIYPLTAGFERYQHQPKDPNSLSGTMVLSFLEDRQGDFWITMDDYGLDKFDRQTKTFTNYRAVMDWTKDDKLSALSAIQDNQNQLWIGTWRDGLLRYNKTTQQTTAFWKYPNGGAHNIWRIFQDSKNRIWASVFYNGLALMNEEGKTLKLFEHDPKNSTTSMTSDENVWAIYEDKQQQIWVGTILGVLKYNENDSTFTQYRPQDNEPNSLSSGDALVFLEDTKNRFWIGTRGGGLNLMDRKTETFKAYRKKDGLSNDNVVGILEDDAGNLWISTVDGLSKFNPETETFINFNVAHGLQANKFNINSYYKDSQGFMYFGGVNGFNRFHPDSIQTNAHVPPVLITDFQIFNKKVAIEKHSVLQQQIHLTDAITLTHQQSVFSLEFSALDYINPDQNQYQYKLENFDSDWVSTTAKRRFVTYTNLPPGEYFFRVKASNNDGLWNQEGTSLKITILPAWWQTRIFKVGVILLIISMIVGFYKYRTYQFKVQQKILEQQVAARTTDLKQANQKLNERKEEILVQNEELQQQSEEIIAQRDLVYEQKAKLEETTKQITKSIQAAKMIQRAILPSEYLMKKHLNDNYFLFYSPKDIVSGDFYWINYTRNRLFVSVVDCTGHGVPGAFMSMIGHSALNKLINEMQLNDPAEILTQLDIEITKMLRQKHSGDRNGMDICLCVLEKSQHTTKVAFAGAKNSLYYTTDTESEVQILKADKAMIGGLTRNQHTFNTQSLQLKHGNLIYLTTDGYIDQNNFKRRRYGSIAFLKLLNSVRTLPIKDQKQVIIQAFEEYKQNEAQRDDVTILGIQL